MGRRRAPWEGLEQGRDSGQGRLFRVVGWDEQTGTHLLLSVPGVEEDTPWEQYVQVRQEVVRKRADGGIAVEPIGHRGRNDVWDKRPLSVQKEIRDTNQSIKRKYRKVREGR